MTTKTTHRPFILTILVVTLFLSYNFINAAWTAPSANPPTNNTEAPINVSATPQMKYGRLSLRAGIDLNVATSALMFRTNGNAMANIFAASTEMRSDRYCDSLGDNCFDMPQPTTSLGLGYNQSWQKVNRTQGVWYQNTTSQPIMIFHKNIFAGSNISVGISTSDFVNLDSGDADSDLDNGLSVIVPPDNYYRMNTETKNSSDAYYVYLELRSGQGGADSGKYVWRVGAWGACSGGTQTRTVTCNNTMTDGVYAASNCTATKPATSQSCATNTGDSHGN